MAVLLGVLAAGYFVLAGLDYGVAMVARQRSEYDRIAPFFLGNEVWLVGAVGFLLGAYPLTDGELLTEHRLPIGVALLGVVMVTAAYGMRLFSRGRYLDVVAKIGGILAASGWGYAFGGTVGGAVAVVLLALHGWAFLNHRWGILAATTVAIVAGVGFVGTHLELIPADEATLRVVVPVAMVIVPLLVLIQALTWWTFRSSLRETPQAAEREPDVRQAV